jgi:hypothetical protein
MTKPKFVKFAFTARRIELARLMLKAAIAEMAAKKSTSADPAEVSFYEKQTAQFQALADLLGATAAAAGSGGSTRKVNLTEEQFAILGGGVKHRNLTEMLALAALPAGAEREQRLAAYDEWAALANALAEKDPRKYDTSQDAEDDNGDDGEDADESD